MRCHISTLTRDDYFLSVDVESYVLNLYKFISKGVYEPWFPESNSKIAVLYYTQREKVCKLSGTDVVIVKHSDINLCKEGQIRVQISLVEHFLRNYPQDADKVVIFRSQDPLISDDQTSSKSSVGSSSCKNNNSRNINSASCNSILSNGRDISKKSDNFYRSHFTSSLNDTVNQKQFRNGITGSSQASSSSCDTRRNNTDSTDNPVRDTHNQIVSYSSNSESGRDLLQKNNGSVSKRKKRDNQNDQNVPSNPSKYTSLFRMKNKADVTYVSQNKKQKKSEEGSFGNEIDLVGDSDESEDATEPKDEVENIFMKHHFIVVKRLLDQKVILCKVFMKLSPLFIFTLFQLVN